MGDETKDTKAENKVLEETNAVKTAVTKEATETKKDKEQA